MDHKPAARLRDPRYWSSWQCRDGEVAGKSLAKVKVVALAVSEMHQQVLACAEAGVAGYVGRDGSERDLVAAAQYALRGELYCSASIAAILSRYIALMSAQASISDEQVALTRREQQILDLIGEGMSNKEIGRALRICDTTVKNHVHNILAKLQVHRRGEAAERLRGQQTASSRFRWTPQPTDAVALGLDPASFDQCGRQERVGPAGSHPSVRCGNRNRGRT